MSSRTYMCRYSSSALHRALDRAQKSVTILLKSLSANFTKLFLSLTPLSNLLPDCLLLYSVSVSNDFQAVFMWLTEKGSCYKIRCLLTYSTHALKEPYLFVNDRVELLSSHCIIIFISDDVKTKRTVINYTDCACDFTTLNRSSVQHEAWVFFFLISETKQCWFENSSHRVEAPVAFRNKLSLPMFFASNKMVRVGIEYDC